MFVKGKLKKLEPVEFDDFGDLLFKVVAVVVELFSVDGCDFSSI